MSLAGRVEFCLNLADHRTEAETRALGFTSMPHCLVLDANGTSTRSIQGAVPADSLRQAPNALGECRFRYGSSALGP